MSSRDLERFLADLDGGDSFMLAPDSTDTLRSSWREAAEAARAAYSEWRRSKSVDAYALYRACADRADAAQDALAERLQRAA